MRLHQLPGIASRHTREIAAATERLAGGPPRRKIPTPRWRLRSSVSRTRFQSIDADLS
jgi:hypothetical protein